MDAVCTDAHSEATATPVVRTASIYALIDPRSGAVRYVGATVLSVSRRLTQHVHDSTRRLSHLPVAGWIRELLTVNLRPRTLVLEAVEFGKQSAAAECKWIAAMRADGESLLNQTDGGYGLRGHKFSDAHRRRLSETNTTSAVVLCHQCHVKFRARQNVLAKGDGKFCSRQCYFAWQRGKTKVVVNQRIDFVPWNKGVARTAKERKSMSDAKRTLTESQVAEMVAMKRSGLRTRDIADAFGVCDRTVRHWIARACNEA